MQRILFLLVSITLLEDSSCHRYGSHYYHMLTPLVGSNFNQHHQPRKTPLSPSKYGHGFWNQKGLVWNNRWRSSSVRTKKQAAEWDEVVPSLLDEVPLETLTIRWPTVNVKIGQPVFVGQMTDRPHLIWPAEPGAFYTIFIWDGGIERVLPKGYFHWLVMNIPGYDVASGKEVFEYVPPFSLELDDENNFIKDVAESSHPMLVLVYKQNNGFLNSIEETQAGCSPDITTSRILDRKKDLVEKYDLQLVAGNYFQCPDDDSAIFLYSALHRFSGDDLFNMLCRVSKCTKQPFPFPLPGINDQPECQPNKKVIAITLRGPKISKRAEYAEVTSIYSPKSFANRIRSTYPEISTGRTKEFRSIDGRFNISRAAPDSNLPQTLEGDMNVEFIEYVDDKAAARALNGNFDTTNESSVLEIIPKLLNTSAGIYKVLLVEPVNQDFDFTKIAAGNQVADLIIAKLNQGDEEKFQKLIQTQAANARNNKYVLSWERLKVREDIIANTSDAFKKTPFYQPAENNEVWMPIYANEEARTKAFQDLAARIPDFFQDFLSTFTCIACTGITDDLHPTYYGPFRYPLYPYFYRLKKPPYISFN